MKIKRFHNEISSAGSDSSEAKSPSNMANSCSTLPGPGSYLAVGTQSDCSANERINLADKAPLTQLPFSTSAPMSRSTKI